MADDVDELFCQTDQKLQQGVDTEPTVQLQEILQRKWCWRQRGEKEEGQKIILNTELTKCSDSYLNLCTYLFVCATYLLTQGWTHVSVFRAHTENRRTKAKGSGKWNFKLVQLSNCVLDQKKHMPSTNISYNTIVLNDAIAKHVTLTSFFFNISLDLRPWLCCKITVTELILRCAMYIQYSIK